MSYVIVQRAEKYGVFVWSEHRLERRESGDFIHKRWWPGLEYAAEFDNPDAASEEIRTAHLERASLVEVTPEIRERITEAKRSVQIAQAGKRRGAYGGNPRMAGALPRNQRGG